MNEAREDVLAFRHFPPQHRKKLWSTNLLERVNVAQRGVLSKAEDKTPLPRDRHLRQRCREHQLGWGGADGAGRALPAGGPPHVLRRKYGRHRSARESAGPVQQSRLRGTKP